MVAGNKDITITISGKDLTAPMYQSAESASKQYVQSVERDQRRLLALWDQQLAANRRRINETMQAQAVVNRARAAEVAIIERQTNAEAAYMRHFRQWQAERMKGAGGGGAGLGGRIGSFAAGAIGGGAAGVVSSLIGPMLSKPFEDATDFFQEGKAYWEGVVTEKQREAGQAAAEARKTAAEATGTRIGRAFEPTRAAQSGYMDALAALFNSDIFQRGIEAREKTIRELVRQITPEGEGRMQAEREVPLWERAGKTRFGLLTDDAIRARVELSKVREEVEEEVTRIIGVINRLTGEQEALAGTRGLVGMGLKLGRLGAAIPGAAGGLFNAAGRAGVIAARPFEAAIQAFRDAAARNRALHIATETPAERMTREAAAIQAQPGLTHENRQRALQQLYFQGISQLPPPIHTPGLAATEGRFITQGRKSQEADEFSAMRREAKQHNKELVAAIREAVIALGALL